MNNTTSIRPRLDAVRNPMEDALNNYGQMERDLHFCQGQVSELSISNGSLLAEVNMLREALERADTDRIRLQSISSTIMGQLMSINAVIGDAVKLSIKHGIEAVEKAPTEEAQKLNRAGGEAREIIERMRPLVSTDGAARVPHNQF